MICCGGGSIYTWSDEWVGAEESGREGEEEEMAECIGVPASQSFRSFPYRDGTDSLSWLNREI